MDRDRLSFVVEDPIWQGKSLLDQFPFFLVFDIYTFQIKIMFWRIIKLSCARSRLDYVAKDTRVRFITIAKISDARPVVIGRRHVRR